MRSTDLFPVVLLQFGQALQCLERGHFFGFQAADFFLEGIAAAEGSECERYTNIYVKLISGYDYCTDSPD